MEENNQNNNIPVKSNILTFGIVCFILPLVGLLIAGIPCGIAAIITGIITIVKFIKEKEKLKAKNIIALFLAGIGMPMGIFDIVMVAIALPGIIENLNV